MLTAAYIRRVCPDAVVATIPSDFRRDLGRRGGGGEPRRLGAFEVDARMRVDGELQQYSLWSKLHTLQWPQWPGWQDTIRQALPVFRLNLRPCALLADGSEAAVPDARLTVYNHNRSRVLFPPPETPHLLVGKGGASIKLLRGSYVVVVDETLETSEEVAPLTLTKVPLGSYEDVELRVPLFAKPKLKVRLVVDEAPAGAEARAPGSLGLANCAASAADVQLTVTDRSKAHGGDVLVQRRGLPASLGTTLELERYSRRVALPQVDLAEQLYSFHEHVGAPPGLPGAPLGASGGLAASALGGGALGGTMTGG
eukprot:1619076-Prymnesium_polylepis.1